MANDPRFEEVLLGGGNAGGKSFVILLWLMQYADVPGYAAAAFRRTSPELHKAGGLIPTSKKILAPAVARGWCYFNEVRRTWHFDSGATLTFGSLQYDSDADALDGPEFQRVAFDELTKFTEYQWTRVQSRLRAPKGFPVRCSAVATSNPDGPGRLWVKGRFGCGVDDIPREKCIYVHSTLHDNPTLDAEDYLRKLAKLPPHIRRQKEDGDWDIESSGDLWSGEHFPRYQVTPRALAAQHRGAKLFTTWDCKNKVSTTRKSKKQVAASGESFVSGCVWLSTPGRLYLLAEEHGAFGLDDTLRAFFRLRRLWPGATAHYIENKAMGPEVIKRLRQGVTLKEPQADGTVKEIRHAPVPGVVAHEPDGDKLTRCERIEPNVLAGDIWAPDEHIEPWVTEWLGELSRAPHPPNDRVDTCIMAVERALFGVDSVAQGMACL